MAKSAVSIFYGQETIALRSESRTAFSAFDFSALLGRQSHTSHLMNESEASVSADDRRCKFNSFVVCGLRLCQVMPSCFSGKAWVKFFSLLRVLAFQVGQFKTAMRQTAFR
jgi:hypothetical protein